jgi:6,7-dimethyl-8-ribityllumazine synthase
VASSSKNLSSYSSSNLGNIEEKKFAIIISEWNSEITEALYSGAVETLIQNGVDRKNIKRKTVPGSFELTLGAQWMAEKKNIDAVICLGCVIKGETRHDEYICQSVSQGLTNVALKFNKPVVFGVLTTNNLQQALDRAGGKHGNKGDESAITAIKMLNF